MNNWTNYLSWVPSVPKTAQVIALVTNGVVAKAMFRATVPTVPVSTKAPICGPPENKHTTIISKYITA
jgi:hypothetical protein